MANPINPNNPWLGIPAEVSGKFITLQEALDWWKNQPEPEPARFSDEHGVIITFQEASELAVKNFNEAVERQINLTLGKIDVYEVAKLARKDFKLEIVIK